VFRTAAGDTIGLADEDMPGEQLLQPVLRAGRLVAPPPPLADVRRLAAAQIAALPAAVRALHDPEPTPPRLSPRLSALEEEMS
jgi:nicotinate phosphoribosyltransferase